MFLLLADILCKRIDSWFCVCNLIDLQAYPLGQNHYILPVYGTILGPINIALLLCASCFDAFCFMLCGLFVVPIYIDYCLAHFSSDRWNVKLCFPYGDHIMKYCILQNRYMWWCVNNYRELLTITNYNVHHFWCKKQRATTHDTTLQNTMIYYHITAHIYAI